MTKDHAPTPHPAENTALAGDLRRIAGLLRAQRASPHRVRAYVRAADTLDGLDEPVRDVLARDGVEGLEALPAIGPRIAALIRDQAQTGRVALLERLEGEVDPEALLASVPGIGPVRASQLHNDLGITTLEDLELAAHDGRIGRLPGFGPRRLEALRATLDHLLTRAVRRRVQPRHSSESKPRPSAKHLLEIDAEYRRRSAADELPRIAPRRFNPSGERWLPILHAERDDWSFTALYSNTARAHQRGRTRDWVVIYFERDGADGQCTVVTEPRGPQRGKRVVRGREDEGAVPP